MEAPDADIASILLGSTVAIATAMVGYWIGKRKTKTVTSLKAAENDSKMVQYTVENSVVLSKAQEELIQRTREQPEHLCLSAPEQIQFLQNLCRSIRASKTLDVGAYTGFSAMSVAMSLPKDGKVVALEVNPEYPEMGRPYWKQAGVENKIELMIGPAEESLEALMTAGQEGTFDFAFIDADKVGYDTYYEMSLKLLRPGGIVALDNMLLNGTVLDKDSTDPKTLHLRALGQKIHRDPRVHASLLYLGDGTLLAFKKEDP